MPHARPHYLDRDFELTDIARILDISLASVGNWLALIRMLRSFGAKRGHRRVFSAHEAYVLALMAALFHGGIPVSAAVIATILSAAYRGPEPVIPEPRTTLTVRETEAVGITIHVAAIWRATIEQLEEKHESD